ncbi:predicted integral membrane protein [Brachybacterium faecium DSM 4810]|uniref:Predicted integral membrane protein n=1 Tax=Brachybacterium faecium (strain ATCC 43885 / DSM 4810 / JCM 11609 / LMG 19847 / NBRC 14762 / NCIMB 9860 / 6-10) TaxID=446465 RepID=C7MGS6_BRAFD|nr:DUF819 family protein [Brachybacterium faecium]ACU84267.1 predicted integral membrane protein [Brachybacterium faecium DSM 4810]HJG51405.1 DUF819 family protein [Brachybacterium faecium]
MITDGVLMLGVLLGLSGLLIVLERTTGWKLFRFVPGMVLMYLLCATLNSLGVFGQDDATREPIAQVKDVLLPAMILLFLFGCDLRKIIRLGPKLLLTMFVASASLFASMIGVYAIFQGFLHSEAWKVFGALLASWTGGSANMVAVQDILQAPENIFGYALITDTLIYSIWLMLMFASVAVSPRFNRWTKADTSYLDTHAGEADDEKRPVTATSLAIVIFGSIFVSSVAIWVGGMLPEWGQVINATTWTIVIVSVLGLIIAVTPLGATAGSSEIATLMLFVVIGQIASGSDFSAITQAPLYLLIGLLVVLIHAAIMVIYAKLTRTELFSLAVASTANIGGIASAPVVASAFNRQLVPVGVLMALIGSFAGTFLGLASAQIMMML